MSEQTKSEQAGDVKKSRFRFNRNFVWGLVAGVLAAVIIGVAVTAIANPDVFRGGDATASEPLPGASLAGESLPGESLPGGVLLQASQVVTLEDFEATVLKSSRPELVLVVDTAAPSPSLDDLVEMLDLVWEGNDLKYYYATDDASREYIGELSVRTWEGQPRLAMFYQGKLTAQQSLLMDADTAALWVTRNYPAKPAPTTTSTTAPAPKPAGPAVFRAFTGSMHDLLEPDPSSTYYLGEVVLSAVDYEMNGFANLDKAITLPVNGYSALFTLVGNRFGGDSANFVLPGLSGQLPLAGLTYQIRMTGTYPARSADEPLQSYTAGDIKYLEIPIESAYDLNVDIQYGDIVLARNVDEIPGFGGNNLIPCDGRELQRSPNEALYSLLGTRFGGDGTEAFRVPDLSGVTPIEGAQYYIAISGLYPSHSDGLPKPTPKPEPIASPVVYRAFTSAMDDRLQLSAASGYYLGEVLLSAADYEISGFLNAKKPNTLPVDSNAALFSLVGNSYGDDSASFALPALSSLQLPWNRTLDYRISTSGVVPGTAGKAAPSHTVGSIKYLEIPVRSISDVGGYLHVGDIILTKGLDGGFGVSRDMLHCDGRALGRTLYKDLYSLLGDRFTDTTEAGLFNIPDLTGAAPIEGASYFIVVNGALPARR